MLIPVKHSVAVMIFNGDEVLSVRRPDDDDELPGVWGLQAPFALRKRLRI